MRVTLLRAMGVTVQRFCVSLSALLLAVGALCISFRTCQAAPALSLSRTRIYGPAIHPKRSSLPINYFYIQAVDTDGNKYSKARVTAVDMQGSVHEY